MEAVMKIWHLVVFAGFITFPVFAAPEFEVRHSFVIVNETGGDIIWQAVYSDDAVGRPILRDNEPVGAVTFSNYPKASYIMRRDGKRGFYTLPYFREYTVLSVALNNAGNHDLPPREIFFKLVKEITVYDRQGNVIMTMDEIGDGNFISEYIHELEVKNSIVITGAMLEPGRKKYAHMPRFDDPVINMPPREDYQIENASGTELAYLIHFKRPFLPNTIGYYIFPNNWKADIFPENNILNVFGLRRDDGSTAMDKVHRIIEDMTICDVSGNVVMTMNDINAEDLTYSSDDLDSEYSNMEYIIRITDADVDKGRIKYKSRKILVNK
jgi:hypothetical protein